MAKVPTPSLATLINDLPKLDGTETGKNILVTTNQGLRKVDWEEFKAWNNYLIGQIVAFPYGVLLEPGFVPLFGGVLKPQWFKDSLKTLKRRCLFWVDQESGNVNLPDMQNIVLQMDYRLMAFQQENDAMQKIQGYFGTMAITAEILTGPFSHYRSGTGFTNAVGGQGQKRDWEFNTEKDPSLRTAQETRENTRNITWCVYAGELVDPNPESLFYTVQYSENISETPEDPLINWPILRLYKPSEETEGIGYNPTIMQRMEVDDPWDTTRVRKGEGK